MGFNVICLEETDSTNLQASALLSQSAIREPTVLVAAYQTGGRGQGQNSWISDRKENLLCSFVVFPEDMKAQDQFRLSVLTSLAVHDLVKAYSPEPAIKWPNDILVNDAKIAGILIENRLLQDRIVSSVIGIGLNVNQTQFPDFKVPATSLSAISKNRLDTGKVLKKLCQTLQNRFNFLTGKQYHAAEKSYLAVLYGIGILKWYRSEDKTFKARISGIDEYGRLMLVTESGETLVKGFKEIEYLWDYHL